MSNNQISYRPQIDLGDDVDSTNVGIVTVNVTDSDAGDTIPKSLLAALQEAAEKWAEEHGSDELAKLDPDETEGDEAYHRSIDDGR